MSNGTGMRVIEALRKQDASVINHVFNDTDCDEKEAAPIASIIECETGESDHLHRLVAHWEARAGEFSASRATWAKKAHELEKYSQEMFARSEELGAMLRIIEDMFDNDWRLMDQSASHHERIETLRAGVVPTLKKYHEMREQHIAMEIEE